MSNVPNRNYKPNREYRYNRAPKLISDGDKFKKEFTMGKAIMPHELVMACSICLDDRDYAAFKLMMFLCSNADGFGLATETICKRCGFAKSTYIDARKKLIKKGWISLIPREAIVIHYDKIYSDYEAKLEEMAMNEKSDDSDENREAIEKADCKLKIVHDMPEQKKPQKKDNSNYDDSAFSAVFSSIPSNDFYMNVGERKEETKEEEAHDEDELPFYVV